MTFLLIYVTVNINTVIL